MSSPVSKRKKRELISELSRTILFIIGLKQRFIESDNDVEDQKYLCHCCQVHKCTDYCMRHKKNTSQSHPRFCRMGAGIEECLGNCKTPGFDYVPNDIIEFDRRGFKSLKLKRTISKQFNQSSMVMLQSWRANCDIKILLYDTHPLYPDIREIANVSDYVVSYTCKGHLTLIQERDIICSAMKRYVK